MIRKLTTMVATAALFVFVAVGTADAQSGGQDPTGFVPMLNAARAARGRAPVGFDATAAAVAYQNNLHQLARGLGHWTLGGYGQVAAIGAGDAYSALALWISSPPHYALLFAPDLVSVGFDIRGYAATASTRQGGSASVGWAWGHQTPAWYYPQAPRFGRRLRRW